MRFDRDGNGAVVYVLTDTLPDWVPLAGEARLVKSWSNGTRQVLKAAAEMSTFTTADIADHPAVNVGERQVLNILRDFIEDGYIAVETEGRGYVWRDDGLHRVNDYGEVELEPVDIDSLSDGEVDQIARNSIYTWNFVNCRKPAGSRCTDTMDGDGSTPVRASIRGDPPPDDTE